MESRNTLGLVTRLIDFSFYRTLKALEAGGLIKRDRRQISFPYWQALRDVGDFNQRYLHLEPQESA